ncbi:SDR family NAD(P)-dependent oxidoreductase [Williamsia muralis]|uniref:3-alpha-hydroxysteroid dehydrogenase n=1 Tax=Williamsia marianensis TaxID=85044 RepID=A0A2G3PK37_WILMA|nr:SDR family oxidoreductase [Williamsia marianensis]PHV66188.1 3-alpha-hydroxysteroid dehydrogenase [Williamsia marianensis]
MNSPNIGMFNPTGALRRGKPESEPAAPVTAVGGRGRLFGQVALIGGGGGGIGRAVAQLFVSEGASVIIADRPESEGKKVAESLGIHAEFAEVDVRNARDWAAAVDTSQNRFGTPPNVFVQVAGVMVGGAVDTTNEEAVRLAFEVNALGNFLGIQAVVPGMKGARRGSIVIVTSMAGVSYGVAGLAPYSMSKAAASALVQCAALDLGQYGIRVNSVVPGQIDTPMSRNAGVSPDPAFFAKMPIPRMGQPRDIAHAALYLACEESSWVTGTHLLVDGGMDAGPVLG